MQYFTRYAPVQRRVAGVFAPRRNDSVAWFLVEHQYLLQFFANGIHLAPQPDVVLVVGAKEEEEGKVSVRSRFAGDEGQCGLEEFIEQIKEEVAAKKLRETVQDK